MEVVAENSVHDSRLVLGTRIDRTSYDACAAGILENANNGASSYVCVATVHMVMEAMDDSAFQRIVNGASLVTPDGVPLVWSLRLLGLRDATRVYGPKLTEFLCAEAAGAGVPVGFYGGTEQAVALLQQNLKREYPSLNVAYVYAPPFRPLTDDEDADVIRDIVASGIRILFVGLGCPKQERWMAQHAGKIPAVMIGVGAAFDFIAGLKRQAPPWIQNSGLEWLFRLATEPRRLWKRYLYHNPRFIYHFALQLFGLRKYGK